MKMRNALTLVTVLVLAVGTVFVTKANHKAKVAGFYYLKTGSYFLISSTIPSQIGSSGTVQATLTDKTSGTPYSLYVDNAGTAAYFTP